MNSLTPIHVKGIEGERSGSVPINAVLAWALLACVIGAALPFGSHRPFFWTFWPFVLGVLGCLYGLVLQLTGNPFRVEPSRIRAELALYLVLCGYLLAQFAPVGMLGWMPPIETQSRLILTANTISVVPGETQLMLLRWLGYGLLFFLALQVARNARRRLLLLRAVSTVGTLYALLSILSFHQWGNTILGFEKWAYLTSVTGTFVNRNSFATFMAICLVVTLSLLVTATTDRQRGPTRYGSSLIHAASALTILAAVFGSNSRMGLVVSLLGAATVVVFATIKRAGERGRHFVLVAAVAVIAVGLVGVLYGDTLWARFLELETASDVRLELYRQVWGMVATRPWLGFGGGAFEQAYQVFHRPPVNADVVWDRAHNTYLTLWSELGLVFGSLPLVIVAVLGWRAIDALRSATVPEATILAWISTIIIAAVHSIVDFSLEIHANALLFTFMAALGTAASLRGRS